jgi:hypothetical protein
MFHVLTLEGIVVSVHKAKDAAIEAATRHASGATPARADVWDFGRTVFDPGADAADTEGKWTAGVTISWVNNVATVHIVG